MIFFLYCIWFRLLQQCWNDNYTINWNSIFQTPSALIPKASLALRILFNISSSKEALKLILFPKYRKDFTNFKVMLSARIWCDGTLYWGLGNIRLLLWIGEGFGLYISFFFFFFTLIVRQNAFAVEKAHLQLLVLPAGHQTHIICKQEV